jgi:DNA-dependent protein kinase catalytic subunit
MGHVLRALKQNREIILNIMQVFVKEPHLDWKSQAKKFELRVHTDSEEPLLSSSMSLDSDVSWYAQKISIAEKKLSGWSSSAIMQEELRLSQHAQKPHFQAALQLIAGDPSHDIRAQTAANNLSISDQINVLIDHASDPNILGRTWQGWAPFI